MSAPDLRPSKRWTTDQLLDMHRLYVTEGKSAAFVGDQYGVSRSAFLGVADRQGWDHERNPEHKATNSRKTVGPPRKDIVLAADTARIARPEPERVNPVFAGVSSCLWPDIPGGCKHAAVRGAYCAQHAARAYVGTPMRRKG